MQNPVADARSDSDHRRMPRAEDPVVARESHERAVADLVGRRVLGVTYWDIHDFGHGRDWDFGDWHLAVMGVELTTDRGPVTVTWDNTFYPYGAELWPHALSEGVVSAEDGPDSWAVDTHPRWRSRLESPVRAASVEWLRWEVGPGYRGDGVRVSEPESHDVPVGLRLDFDAGSVWLIAAMPDGPHLEKPFVGGDEILVVFDADRLRRIGFDGTFVT
jgi:hypothetical protein